jgi:FAD synthetase
LRNGRRTLPEVCYTLRRKLNAFLDEQTDDEVLRNVQSQARVSMGVIDEALHRYGWVPRQRPSVTPEKQR